MIIIIIDGLKNLMKLVSGLQHLSPDTAPDSFLFVAVAFHMMIVLKMSIYLGILSVA